MYEKYAIEQGWKMSEISSNEAENGGYKEIVMQVPDGNPPLQLRMVLGIE